MFNNVIRLVDNAIRWEWSKHLINEDVKYHEASDMLRRIHLQEKMTKAQPTIANTVSKS